MECIRNSWGNHKLLYEGFIYVLDKEETSYWRCKHARNALADPRLCLTHYGRDHYSIRILRLHFPWLSSVQFQQRDIALKNLPATSSRTALRFSIPKRETLVRMIRRKGKAPDGDDIFDEFNTKLYAGNISTAKRLVPNETFDSAPSGHQLYTLHVITRRRTEIPTSTSSSSSTIVGLTSLHSQR